MFEFAGSKLKCWDIHIHTYKEYNSSRYLHLLRVREMRTYGGRNENLFIAPVHLTLETRLYNEVPERGNSRDEFVANSYVTHYIHSCAYLTWNRSPAPVAASATGTPAASNIDYLCIRAYCTERRQSNRSL
jgi:hypothetical protein